MGFFKKKEEKKKFDYSDDTKELFAERDAFYAEQRRKLGGGDSNPELDNQTNPEVPKSRDEDLGDLLGDSNFNPYVNQEETGESNVSSIPATPSTGSSSSSTCQSCGKEFQSSEFNKCPMCGGDMKKAEATPSVEPTPSPVSQPDSTPITSIGDPLDDLLGDFNSPTINDAPSDDTEDSDLGVRTASDDTEDSDLGVRTASDNTEDSDPGIRTASDDLGTDFGQSRSSHSNRKVRKVKKVKRPRKSL